MMTLNEPSTNFHHFFHHFPPPFHHFLGKVVESTNPYGSRLCELFFLPFHRFHHFLQHTYIHVRKKIKKYLKAQGHEGYKVFFIYFRAQASPICEKWWKWWKWWKTAHKPLCHKGFSKSQSGGKPGKSGGRIGKSGGSQAIERVLSGMCILRVHGPAIAR